MPQVILGNCEWVSSKMCTCHACLFSQAITQAICQAKQQEMPVQLVPAWLSAESVSLHVRVVLNNHCRVAGARIPVSDLALNM